MIKISYKIKHSELARASLFFIENKLALKVLINIVNISAIIMLLLATLKLLTYQRGPDNFSLNDAGIIFFTAFWLTMRQNMNEWLIKRRIARNLTNNKNQVIIEISENGLLINTNAYTNKQTAIAWKNIKKIFAIKNGFIVPISNIDFIWLPFHGFTGEEEITIFLTLIKHRNIKKITAKWSC